MYLNLYWTYKFLFIDEFSTLDNVYTVNQISTYNEIIKENSNALVELYTSVGKSESDLITDLSNYTTGKIFKLTNTTNSSSMYVPESIIKDTPIFNVKQYSKLIVSHYVGVYPGEDDLEAIKSSIQEQLSASLGYTEKPDVITIEKVYLTEDEYNTLNEQRKSNIDEVINYYSENVKLRQEIDKLKTIIAGQDKIIKAISEVS